MTVEKRDKREREREKATIHKTAFLILLRKDKLEDEAYVWMNGNIVCRCCPSAHTITYARKMKSHPMSKKHQTYLLT